MTYTVTLTRGLHSSVYGTYSTLAAADIQAAAHRQAGYYTVTITDSEGYQIAPVGTIRDLSGLPL